MRLDPLWLLPPSSPLRFSDYSILLKPLSAPSDRPPSVSPPPTSIARSLLDLESDRTRRPRIKLLNRRRPSEEEEEVEVLDQLESPMGITVAAHWRWETHVQPHSGTKDRLRGPVMKRPVQ